MDHPEDSPRLAPSRPKIRSWLEPALWLVLLIVPLAIGLAWGTFLDDSAYVTFRHARNLANTCPSGCRRDSLLRAQDGE